jgi:cytochrome P450
MDGNDITARAVRSDIPEALVWRKSFAAFTAELDDPYVAVSRLEAMPPLVWGVELGTGAEGGWVVTDPDVMAEVFLDAARFSAHRPSMLADILGVDVKLNPLDFDPPEHMGYRRILQPLFAPKAIAALEAKVRETCDALIAGFADADGCEFMADMAIPFPSYIFLDMMGMPQAMLPQFLSWQKAFLAPDPMGKVGAARAIYAYFETFLEEQRREPTSDFVGAILAGEYDGRPLTHTEIMGMFYVLYLAGLDTVTSTVGWVMRHLATHPELQDRLRDEPEQMPRAIEEFIRAFGVARTFRTATADMAFHGAPVRKGDKLHLPTMLASRHSRGHADPHAVDIDRRGRHLSFGTGAHTCLGMHLARRELTILLETFLSRFRDIRLRDGARYDYETHANFGVTYLPLQWDPA